MDSNCTIEETVAKKLNEYNLTPYEQLEVRTKERLIRVEQYVQNNMEKTKALAKELKKMRLSKTTIADDENVNISRKTIYNDEVLNLYIDHAIQEQHDYFNVSRITQLEEQIKEIKEQYDKVLDQIIDTNILKLQVKQYKEEIKKIIKLKENLEVINKEKDDLIKVLKSNQISNIAEFRAK